MYVDEKQILFKTTFIRITHAYKEPTQTQYLFLSLQLLYSDHSSTSSQVIAMADKSAFVPLDTSGDTSKTNDLDLDLDGDFFGDKGSGSKAPPPPPPKPVPSPTSVPAKATSSTKVGTLFQIL
ncbi:hypothetical protein DdX_08093 [Ditylenchus destructor]|uniref:Uncharacterized protein n=1 Tax=Ditylenchus destructor TaxID=166010 RepID=A0AAD4R7V4_9BILA|nr:hypothetical protein DdX_08093 [Ditylenchus destructor]